MSETREKGIHIVFSSDEGYFVPTYVALFSLLSNYKGRRRLCVHIMVPGDYPERLERAWDELASRFPDVEIDIINMGKMYDSVAFHLSHTGTPTMYRLSIPRVLEGVDKCIYLDSDIVVEGDVSELDEIDVEGMLIAGVKDGVQLDPRADKMVKELGIPSIDHYVNAGVLIMNLEEFRKEGLTERLELVGYETDYYFKDQDVLNSICYDKTKLIPLRYNALTTYLNLKDDNYHKMYGEEEYERASREPVIVHYITCEKPWGNKYVKEACRWWAYAEKLDGELGARLDRFLKDHQMPLKKRVKWMIKRFLGRN